LKEALPASNLCFVDDLSLSGEQARDYLDSLPKVPRDRTTLLFMAVTSIAKDLLTREGFKVIAPIVIDEKETKLGAASGMILDCGLELRGVATEAELRRFAEEYGRLAWSGFPMGFKALGLALGLHHNTPDDTLPIFWSDVNWFPIMPRHPKVEGGVVPEERYFV